jgi:hypothetical protein
LLVITIKSANFVKKFNNVQGMLKKLSNAWFNLLKALSGSSTIADAVLTKNNKQ